MMTYLAINLEALAYNVQVIRSLIGRQRLLCAVVKANAYGHGLVAIAQQLSQLDVQRLAVATVQELRTLRKANIRLPIMVMGAVLPQERDEAIGLAAIPFISSKEELVDWQARAIASGQHLTIHVKVNSSMNRLGVDYQRSLELIEFASSLQNITLEGVALHLAQADRLNSEQMQEDISMIAQLKTQLQNRCPGLLYNVASSAALINYPQALYDMVRPGLALYGYGLANLRPVLNWISHVMHIRQVPAGEPISYGASYVTARATYIGVVPVGYADGYPREFTEQAYVVIKDKRYAVVGRVCMNQLMIDLGEQPSIQLYERVYLIDNTLTNAEVLAKASNTISYRILTSLNPSIPRIYQSSSQEF